MSEKHSLSSTIFEFFLVELPSLKYLLIPVCDDFAILSLQAEKLRYFLLILRLAFEKLL